MRAGAAAQTTVRVGLAAVAISCAPAAPSTADAAPQAARSDWPAYGADAGGTRYSALDQIHRGNVAALAPAWIFRTGELGQGAADGADLTFETTPIHFEGRLYLSTGLNEVIALDPVTGAELWRSDAGADRREGYSEVTSRGVAAWRDAAAADAPCAARIFTGTIDGRLLALDAATGRRCASFGEGGEVALWRLAGIEPGEVGDYQVTSAPAVVGDVVVVGPSIGDNFNVDTGDGSVRGFDARSGAPIWSWSPLEDRVPGRVGAANAWSTLSADAERGLVFVPTGSASPDFYGGLRPGDNRWANSVVALDAASGRLVWGFQTVHHDLFDYDLAAQPTLATVTLRGGPRSVVVQPTKTGLLFVLDREDGTPVFGVEERPVPSSDTPGEAASPTQPFPRAPAPLIADSGIDPARPWGATPEHAAACARLARGHRYEGTFTPPSLEGSLLYPGNGAGTNWGSAALDPARELLVIPTTRFGTLVRLIEPEAAADSARQARATGDEAEVSRQRGARYGMLRRTWMADGILCTPPPWGVLTAIDLGTGEKRWEIPLGERDTGLPSSGGPIVTAGDLVFMAGTPDQMFRAYDIDTGEVLWRAELPRAGIATPMTYLGEDGRQYVVVAAGGHGKWGLEPGDHVVAFALPPAAPDPRDPGWQVLPGERFGPITDATSERDLVALLGGAAVERAEIYLAEGFCTPGTRVFPGGPAELEVAWADSARTRPAFVRTRGAPGLWRTPRGVGVGTTLAELERLRGGVVTFSGFGWDYGGGSSWEEHRGSLHLRLAIDPASRPVLTELARRDPRVNEIDGDRVVRSDHPIIRRISVSVEEISMHWARSFSEPECGGDSG